MGNWRSASLRSEDIWPMDTAVGEHPPILPLSRIPNPAGEPTEVPAAHASPSEFPPEADTERLPLPSKCSVPPPLPLMADLLSLRDQELPRGHLRWEDLSLS